MYNWRQYLDQKISLLEKCTYFLIDFLWVSQLKLEFLIEIEGHLDVPIPYHQQNLELRLMSSNFMVILTNVPIYMIFPLIFETTYGLKVFRPAAIEWRSAFNGVDHENEMSHIMVGKTKHCKYLSRSKHLSYNKRMNEETEPIPNGRWVRKGDSKTPELWDNNEGKKIKQLKIRIRCGLHCK